MRLLIQAWTGNFIADSGIHSSVIIPCWVHYAGYFIFWSVNHKELTFRVRPEASFHWSNSYIVDVMIRLGTASADCVKLRILGYCLSVCVCWIWVWIWFLSWLHSFHGDRAEQTVNYIGRITIEWTWTKTYCRLMLLPGGITELSVTIGLHNKK